jgi:replicative DNA helicase
VIDADTVQPASVTDESLFDGDPIPLSSPASVPEFPVGALPGPYRDMVSAVAETTQTDPAMAGTSALSVISVCTGGNARLEVRPGWVEPLVIYALVIAESGERKSAVQQAITEPLRTAERRLAKDAHKDRADAIATRQLAVKQAAKLRSEAVYADDSEREEKAKAALDATAAIEDIEIPPIPRLLADDITPEATGSLLAEQGGRLGIISAEGGIFETLGGRYSHNIPNIDVYTKGHSGDPVTIDRKSRPPEIIPRPALTLGLMVQPQVLHAIAANPVFRGRGLLARFCYSRPVSRVGYRRVRVDPFNQDTVDAYALAVTELAAEMRGWGDDPAVLQLSDGARESILTIAENIEVQLRDDGLLAHLKDWGNKYTGLVVRLAGMLHLADLRPAKATRTPVDTATVLAAANLGGYFKACAINAFIEMQADSGLDDARYVLGRLGTLVDDQRVISERDLHRGLSRARFPKKEAMMPAIDRLVDHGYLAPLPAEQTKSERGGRPASRKYRLHASIAKTT